MLTSIGRAAARRVVSANRSLTTGATATTISIARPLAMRSFTNSRWSFMAAKAAAATPKKAAPKKQASTKIGENRGRPRKGAPPRPKAKKAKAKAVKKPAKKVKKPAKKPAKVALTPEQKERRKVRQLRETALLKEEPKQQKLTPFNIYIINKTQSQKGETIRTVAQSYHQLSSSEFEDLKRQADVKHEKQLKDHADWQAAVPIEDIYLANLARRQLRRLKKRTSPIIQDDRMPRRPNSPLNEFIKREVDANHKLGEVVGRYKYLSESEKDALAPTYKQDLEEYKKAFGVIRQMADLKIKQGKVKAALDPEKDSDSSE